MQAREVADYLSGIADKLGELGGSFVDGPNIDLDRRATRGSLSLAMEFLGGAKLDVAIVVSIDETYTDWLGYSFHFMDSRNSLVFRYDSAPHHPGGPHFPHHKHVGPKGSAEDHARPSVAEIVEEVRGHLYGDSR
jgi:hypothetical protein